MDGPLPDFWTNRKHLDLELSHVLGSALMETYSTIFLEQGGGDFQVPVVVRWAEKKLLCFFHLRWWVFSPTQFEKYCLMAELRLTS